MYWIMSRLTHISGYKHRVRCAGYRVFYTNWNRDVMGPSKTSIGVRAWAEGLTHWGRATHICVSKLTIIGSDTGLSPGRCQAIIWTNAGILLIRTLGTNFREILGEINSFSFSKMHSEMSSAKWRLFGLGLNEFNHTKRGELIIHSYPGFNGGLVKLRLEFGHELVSTFYR